MSFNKKKKKKQESKEKQRKRSTLKSFLSGFHSSRLAMLQHDESFFMEHSGKLKTFLLTGKLN